MKKAFIFPVNSSFVILKHRIAVFSVHADRMKQQKEIMT